MSLSSSNYMNEQFSNLSMEDLRPAVRKEKALTPLLNEFEIDHGTNNSPVNVVHFCPFEHNANLLIYQSSEEIGKLSVFLVDFNKGQFKSEFLEDIVVGGQVHKIAWSPQTSVQISTDLRARSGLIKLAVTLFHLNEIQFLSLTVEPAIGEQNDETQAREFDVKRCSEQIAHCINDISFEPINGELLASTGDDKVCYIWNTATGDLYSMFKLTSAGMTVKWHQLEPNKLLVAEKKGLIRFYDVSTKSAILSFSCDSSLLLSADWCRSNNFLIACTSGANNVFWNTAQSSYPTEKIKGHIKFGEQFAFFDDNIYASRGKPNSQLLVQNRRSGQILFDKELKAGRGLSWHLKYPILAVGAYNKVSGETGGVVWSNQIDHLGTQFNLALSLSLSLSLAISFNHQKGDPVLFCHSLSELPFFGYLIIERVFFICKFGDLNKLSGIFLRVGMCPDWHPVNILW